MAVRMKIIIVAEIMFAEFIITWENILYSNYKYIPTNIQQI